MNESTTGLPTGYSIVIPNLEDAQRVCDLGNLYDESATGERLIEAENLRTAWTSPNFELESAARAVAGNEGNRVAFATVWNAAEPHVEPGLTLWTPPKLDLHEVALRLTAWAEKVVRGTASILSNVSQPRWA